MKARALPVVLLIALAGCRGGDAVAGHAGLPASGQVRIVPTRIQEDARKFSWLWTIVGDRNWINGQSNGSELRLSGSYPLNSKDRGGGTHIWEARIEVEPGKSPSSFLLNVKLRGSNAAMGGSTADVELGPGVTLTGEVRAIQPNETTLALPATLKLATVGRRTITLRIDE